MFDLESLVRPNILALKPYSSARDEFEGEASVWLDANENSLAGTYARYPDPLQRTLRQLIAEKKGLDAAQIFIGNGSDEAIDLLFRVFCRPGVDNVIIMPPTYGMYAVQAGIHDVALRRAPLRPDFSPDATAVKAVTDAQSRLLFLCSPNNPTGQLVPEDFVLDMLDTFPGLVVLDEAYIDFAGKPSWLTRLDDFPNLVVLQTLSKAWGLAALRVGMAFAGAGIIQLMNRVKFPYNLNVVSTQIAADVLGNEAPVQAQVQQLLAERDQLARALSALPCVVEVFPSDANFLLLRCTDADGLYAFLCREGIVVRNRSREQHCTNCLRVTVGTPEENRLLLATIRRYT